MTLQVSPSDALDKIEEFIEEIEELLEMPREEGEDRKEDLRRDVENFMNVAFSDSDEKLKNFRTLEFIVKEKTDEEKQEKYESDLNHYKECLQDLEDEIELALELNKENEESTKVSNEASSNFDNSSLSAGRDININSEANQSSNIEEYKGDKKQIFLIESYSKFLDSNFNDTTVGLIALLEIAAALLSMWGSLENILGYQLPSYFLTLGVIMAFLGVLTVGALKFKQRRTCSDCGAKFSMEEYKEPDVKRIEKEDGYKYKINRFLKCQECGETNQVKETDFEPKEDT